MVYYCQKERIYETIRIRNLVISDRGGISSSSLPNIDFLLFVVGTEYNSALTFVSIRAIGDFVNVYTSYLPTQSHF